MANFKVGDKVRYKANMRADIGPTHDMIGEVTLVRASGVFTAIWPNGRRYTHSPEYLELAPDIKSDEFLAKEYRELREKCHQALKAHRS